ncbi:MAG: group II intron maturase-specific domain-containing protein [Steroidobacteraceae bacterium]
MQQFEHARKGGRRGEATRKCNYRNRTELSLRDISRLHNPVLRRWVAYYGRFYPSAMYPVFRHFNKTLVA